jgi:hypothetical protein
LQKVENFAFLGRIKFVLEGLGEGRREGRMRIPKQ